MGARTIRLTSSPMVNTPGLFRWCQAAWRSGDATTAERVLTETYGLRRPLAEALLAGTIMVTVDGDAVCFEVPDEVTFGAGDNAQALGPDEDPSARRFYLLVIHGDVEPEVRGPFERAQLRDEAAREHRSSDPDKDDGLYRLDVSAAGSPSVAAYGGSEFCDARQGAEF